MAISISERTRLLYHLAFLDFIDAQYTMPFIPCPYLKSQVELTDERRQHILDKHPDLLPDYLDRITKTVADPDEVRRDRRFPMTRILSRWYDDLKHGKHVAVVIVTDSGEPRRHWLVTAYLCRRVRQGVTEWKRS